MEEIWNSLGSTGHIVVIVLLVIALVVIGFLTMWKRCPRTRQWSSPVCVSGSSAAAVDL